MFARTERGYIYTTTGNQVYGQQVGGKLTPYPCVAGVSPADLAAAAGADLVGSVVDVNRVRRFVLTVVAVETVPEGAVGCEIDRLWNDKTAHPLSSTLRFFSGVSRKALRDLILSGSSQHVAVTLAGTTFDGRLERIAKAKAGGKAVAKLVPQPGNRFDRHAISVEVDEIGSIGMIPKTLTRSIIRSGEVPIVRMECFKSKTDQQLWSVTIRAQIPLST